MTCYTILKTGTFTAVAVPNNYMLHVSTAVESHVASCTSLLCSAYAPEPLPDLSVWSAQRRIWCQCIDELTVHAGQKTTG